MLITLISSLFLSPLFLTYPVFLLLTARGGTAVREILAGRGTYTRVTLMVHWCTHKFTPVHTKQTSIRKYCVTRKLFHKKYLIALFCWPSFVYLQLLLCLDWHLCAMHARHSFAKLKANIYINGIRLLLRCLYAPRTARS
jgi:hypothetical protein